MCVCVCLDPFGPMFGSDREMNEIEEENSCIWAEFLLSWATLKLILVGHIGTVILLGSR